MSTVKKHIILLLLVITPVFLCGQSKVIVVTRTVKQNWDVSPSSTLFLNTEKAKIIIRKSSSSSVELQLKLKSKHTNINIARKELQYLKYTLNKKGKDIYVNNNILIPANKPQPESRLSAEYIISVPEGCHIHLKNSLGDIYLNNLNNTINTELKYGNLSLQNSQGEININVRIGDINLNEVTGKVEIVSEYSEIDLKKINGAYSLLTKYGSLNIVPDKYLKNLNIESNKTDILILNKLCEEYNFNVQTQYGSVSVSQTCYIKTESFLSKTIHKKIITDLKYEASEDLPRIKINSKFSNINLW